MYIHVNFVIYPFLSRLFWSYFHGMLNILYRIYFQRFRSIKPVTIYKLVRYGGRGFQLVTIKCLIIMLNWYYFVFIFYH